MPNLEAIIRSVCVDEEGRDFLQAFDEMWKSAAAATPDSERRDRVQERLACCLVLISTGLFAETPEQASAIANRLPEAVCDTDFLIGDSRTLDLRDIE